MFAPPQVLTTEVFAEVPSSLRRHTKTGWTETNRPGLATPSFLEGPSFDRVGNLYLVDIPHGRIFRVSPAGQFDVIAEYDGEPNGLKIHQDGRIFIADYKNGLMQLDAATGAVTPFLERRHSERFKGLNDLFFGTNGDLYFTDQGETGLQDPTGRVYRLTPEGRLDCLVGSVPSPKRARHGSAREGAIRRRDARQLRLAAAQSVGNEERQSWRLRTIVGRARRTRRSGARRRRATSRLRISVSAACGCSRRTASHSIASIPAADD